MTTRRIEPTLLLTIALILPLGALGQDDMTFDEEEVTQDEGTGDAGDDMSFDEEEAADTGDAEGAAGGEGQEASGGADEGLLGLEDIGLDAGTEVEVGVAEEEKKKEGVSEGDLLIQRHPIWAVQQVYALRKGRVDFQPAFGVSMNDPFVQHQSVSLALSYYITEVFAVGASFNWYRWLDNNTDVNFRISRATHQTVPINEYMLGAQLNFLYVPMYGKFALANQWILHWDVWFIGGAGIIVTRPIPVIDPDYRSFDFKPKAAFNVGLGGRLYLTRFAAIYVELRDYMFMETLESTETYGSDLQARQDKSNWTGDKKFTNNVTLLAGVSLFFPFTFDFKLPK